MTDKPDKKGSSYSFQQIVSGDYVKPIEKLMKEDSDQDPPGGSFDDKKLKVVNAEELRQYLYCKRIIYWRNVVGIHGKKSRLMTIGEEYHEQRKKYNYQRKGDIDNIRDRYFFNQDKHFGGKIDILRVLEDEIIPLEVKRFFHHKDFTSYAHIAQAVLGGMAAEYELGLPMRRIEIKYFRGVRSLIDVTSKMRTNTEALVFDIRTMIDLDILPNPTPHKKKCEMCEYWKICRRV